MAGIDPSCPKGRNAAVNWLATYLLTTFDRVREADHVSDLAPRERRSQGHAQNRTIELSLLGLLTVGALLFSAGGESLRASAELATNSTSQGQMPPDFDAKSPELLLSSIKLKPTRCGRWTKPRSIVRDRSTPWAS